MAISILLVTCESTWLAPIRMPGALARAGFDVTLLAPPDAVAARSRYVARSRALPANANAREWLLALVAAIDACRPELLLPGDETSLRLLQAFVLAPPPLLGRELTRALADLIVHSLGAPEFYDAATDKARLASLMHAAGVRMPEQIVVATPDDAHRATGELGSSVVVKPSNGTGGRDVIACDSPDAAAAAFLRVQAGQRGIAALDRAASVIMQRRIVGQMLGRTSVAWRGVELGGFSRNVGAPDRGTAVRARGPRAPARSVQLERPVLRRLDRGAARARLFARDRRARLRRVGTHEGAGGHEPRAHRVVAVGADRRGERHRRVRRDVVVRPDGARRHGTRNVRAHARAYATALRVPDVVDRLATLGATVVANSPLRFADDIRADYARWSAVIGAANIRL